MAPLIPLEDATVALAHDAAHAAPALQTVDRFVTSRAGFAALLLGRYRITPDGEEWDDVRLAEELTAAAAKRGVDGAAAARTITRRTIDVGRVVTFSDGPERRGLVTALSPITAGTDPYRPVNVPVTAMAQTQLDLGPALGGIAVRSVSAGPTTAPHVLLIHGHASRLEEYEQLARLLAARFRVHVVDLPGAGYSEKPEIDYSIDHYEQVLGRVIELLCPSGTLYVAGGGLGGNLSLRLALRDGARRITAICAWSVAGWGEAKPVLAAAARLLAHLPDFAFFAVAKQQLDEQYSAGFAQRDALIAAGMAYRHEVYGAGFQTAYAQIAADQVGTSLLARAKEIRTPVQLLAGELDRGKLDIRGAVEHLAQTMGVTPVVVPGSGYAIATERPDVLAQQIATFFAQSP